ncbi:MAG: hypothetical protein U1C46_05750 [Bacteroidales bacterium]|nr:hypothetical protein [Bacteroidales bacterium]MDZ4204306.1 hypothetical protein [Bacteroidales bacterium]
MPAKNKQSTIAWIIWALLLAILVVMNLWIIPSGSKKIMDSADNPASANLLDLQIVGFSETEVYTVLNSLGEEGRRQYAQFALREDFYYPLSYGIFLAFTLYSLAAFCLRRRIRVLIIALIPLIGMAADYVENFHILSLIRQFPDLHPGTVQIASVANTLKWGLVFLSAGLVLVFLVWGLVQKWCRKKSVNPLGC